MWSTNICDVIWENPSHGAKLIFWVIGIMWKFELFSFQNFYLDLLWYWYQKLLMFKCYINKEKHKNYDVSFLYFAVSPFATCDRFFQITSQMRNCSGDQGHFHCITCIILPLFLRRTGSLPGSQKSLLAREYCFLEWVEQVVLESWLGWTGSFEILAKTLQ